MLRGSQEYGVLRSPAIVGSDHDSRAGEREGGALWETMQVRAGIKLRRERDAFAHNPPKRKLVIWPSLS